MDACLFNTCLQSGDVIFPTPMARSRRYLLKNYDSTTGKFSSRFDIYWVFVLWGTHSFISLNEAIIYRNEFVMLHAEKRTQFVYWYGGSTAVEQTALVWFWIIYYLCLTRLNSTIIQEKN